MMVNGLSCILLIVWSEVTWANYGIPVLINNSPLKVLNSKPAIIYTTRITLKEVNDSQSGAWVPWHSEFLIIAVCLISQWTLWAVFRPLETNFVYIYYYYFFIIKLCYFLALNCGEVSFFPRCLHLTTNVIPVFFQYSCLQGSIVAIHWCNTGWNLNWWLVSLSLIHRHPSHHRKCAWGWRFTHARMMVNSCILLSLLLVSKINHLQCIDCIHEWWQRNVSFHGKTGKKVTQHTKYASITHICIYFGHTQRMTKWLLFDMQKPLSEALCKMTC